MPNTTINPSSMKFYVYYKYIGDLERGVPPYESYAMFSTDTNIMTSERLSEIHEALIDYVSDEFNLDEISEDDLIIKNWKIVNG